MDGAKPEGTVRPASREDHADRTFPLVIGKRTEEGVYGQPHPPCLFRDTQVEHTMEDCHVLVGRDGIDMVGLNCYLVLRLMNGHRGDPLEDIRQHAFMARVEMGDKHERHAAVGRHCFEEEFKCFKPTGRGPDPDDGKGYFASFAPGIFLSHSIFFQRSLGYFLAFFQ